MAWTGVIMTMLFAYDREVALFDVIVVFDFVNLLRFHRSLFRRGLANLFRRDAKSVRG